MNRSRLHRTRALVAVAAVLALLVGAGCTRQQRAEQDGRKGGEALCDVRGAEDEEAAQAALEELREQLSDLTSKYSVFTAEDRADIDENLTDLVEHVMQENDVLAQQDLVVIRRSLENIADDVSDTSRAAIDGFLQGLDDCV